MKETSQQIETRSFPTPKTMTARHRLIPGASACVFSALLAGCASSDPFLKLDTNRDGSGSRSEFDAYMKQAVFAQIDANDDAKVTIEEWQAFNPKVSSDKFRRTDPNRDGVIDRREADAAFEHEGSLTTLFGKIDTDGNGSLSRAEVSAFHSKLRQQPGASPAEKISNATSQS
jgi:hypothetical protein